jgi:hypothetical protein
MKKRIGVALLPALLLTTMPAFAHSPIMGIGGVTGGVLHALLIPEHGLGLIALGLALGQLEATTGILGLLVVTLWTPTYLVWVFAAVVGLTIGLDSRPEVASNDEAVRMLIGSGLGAAARGFVSAAKQRSAHCRASDGVLDHRDCDPGSLPPDRHPVNRRLRIGRSDRTLIKPCRPSGSVNLVREAIGQRGSGSAPFQRSIKTSI